jgi:hypothetical protein
MKKKIASAVFILVCGGLAVGALMHMMGDAFAPASGLSESENRILAQLLAHRFADGGYNVVSPKTVVAPLWGNDARSTEARRQQIIAVLAPKNPAAASMVARLYHRNAASVELALKSDPQQGYIVDDGSYEALFGPGGGGWKQWREKYPKAHGYIRFSRPVYDPGTGLFLVYVEGRDPVSGIGVVKMMKDDHGTITTVGVVQLWKL